MRKILWHATSIIITVGFQVLAASEASNVRRMRINAVQLVLKIQNLTGYVDPVYDINDKPSRLNHLNAWQQSRLNFVVSHDGPWSSEGDVPYITFGRSRPVSV